MSRNAKHANHGYTPAHPNNGVSIDGIKLDKNDLNDTDLMMAIAAGDAPAGNVFISRHLPYVMNICRHYLKNEAEAEEAAQDVFATIWRKADQFSQRDAKVTTWLYSVTRNRCIDILRRQKPDTRH